MTGSGIASKRSTVAFDRKSLRAVSYSTVGIELTLSVLCGFFGGRWLDAKFATEPVLAILGLAFGVAAGFRSLYRATMRMKHETETDGFRAADVGRSARFAMSERMAASRERSAIREESLPKPASGPAPGATQTPREEPDA